jgi:hypothetical protein
MDGYAVGGSCCARGYSTEAVLELIERAHGVAAERIVPRSPLDRPGSGRLLETAAFLLAGEEDDEHDGVPMRVRRGEREL